MQNTVAPILNDIAGRMAIIGVVDAVSGPLLATFAPLAALAAVLGLFWLDPVNRGHRE